MRQKGAGIIEYVRNGESVVGGEWRGSEVRKIKGRSLWETDCSNSLKPGKFGALQQSVSLSSAAMRCGVEFQS